ncbi:YhjD/YihY/BrkB family envelope integrity protein [Kitasatospora sp. NPDC059571]|uniref:YhjD/YihY/BrkB family envelope integrity protein n=1 Tax=Kitasatospora sp. NPDC059571 TaxID=3346871 RepID=UPI00368F760B
MTEPQQPGLRARASALAVTVRGLPDRIPLVGRALHQMIRVNLLDNSTRLAAQAFLSALPALFVVAVFAPASVKDGIVSSMREQLGLRGVTDAQVQQLMSPGEDDVAQGIGAFGALVTLLSATAMSRALQRVFERCWDLPRAGGRVAIGRWVLWLLVWLVALIFQHPLHDGFGLGRWLGLPLTFAATTALWWWTQHLLLAGRVGWRPLLPGALLCGVAVLGVGAVAEVYLPRAVSESVGRFGSYGAVLTALSWLIVLFTAITLAVMLGRVLAEEPPVARLLGIPEEPGEPGDRDGRDGPDGPGGAVSAAPVRAPDNGPGPAAGRRPPAQDGVAPAGPGGGPDG